MRSHACTQPHMHTRKLFFFAPHGRIPRTHAHAHTRRFCNTCTESATQNFASGFEFLTGFSSASYLQGKFEDVDK